MGNGMLSQEEIDALLRGTFDPEPPEAEETPENLFSDIEKDAIGEIANISMGTAATTLSLLLNKKVEITTPKVDLTTSEQIRKDYPVPSVIVDVKYKMGIKGSNLLILTQRDGAVIVDLMMGGDGTNPSPELSELHLSGISEAMNQMMGSAATSMSTMFNSVIDITPPNLVLNDFSLGQTSLDDILHSSEPYVRISFRMVVVPVIDSTLVQIIPITVAKGMVAKLLGGVDSPGAAPAKPETPAVSASPSSQPGGNAAPGYLPQQDAGYPNGNPNGFYGALSPNIPYGAPPPGAPYGSAYAPSAYGMTGGSTQVQSAQFAPLQQGPVGVPPNNLGLILDVPLQVSVELGKAKKTIKEILEMGPGSVIELDRLAGEPVDMIVNGKLVAKCEVVVINETFGIRITDIVNPAERVQTLA